MMNRIRRLKDMSKEARARNPIKLSHDNRISFYKFISHRPLSLQGSAILQLVTVEPRDASENFMLSRRVDLKGETGRPEHPRDIDLEETATLQISGRNRGVSKGEWHSTQARSCPSHAP